MALQLTHAQTDDDLRQILALQQKNLRTELSAEARQQQGFVTVRHTWEQLRLMHSLTPQVMAKDGDEVVAFALAMLPTMGTLIPDLQPMFALMDEVLWQESTLAQRRYYVMGQVCVDERWRGQGVFDQLYQKHKDLYYPHYDLLVTEISTANVRSQRAHERVGFRTIHRHRDHVDDWNVVVWAWV
ncbi:RimJ/RimL family protein N-acetyltransferase [Rhabdobacter roseus]|uniref:RimJ/RimL family protein N-acetyltransferase n=1 Tax=Rhabdobacter roseus TaxID=1655419 RepID=A0A840TV62_9BACT|nr:GNAT family N-acetyltransferase [Rhabdobacter roseus]MBB5285153.1 RimJ/RimL family protein N-acetyltransferase [Rhabdobacter roseus]